MTERRVKFYKKVLRCIERKILFQSPATRAIVEGDIEDEEPELDVRTVDPTSLAADRTFVKELDNPESHDSENLVIPKDPHLCRQMVERWETFGFGPLQLHFDRCGREPANKDESTENGKSRSIRSKICKIWKTAEANMDSYRLNVDAAKALANARRLTEQSEATAAVLGQIPPSVLETIPEVRKLLWVSFLINSTVEIGHNDLTMYTKLIYDTFNIR